MFDLDQFLIGPAPQGKGLLNDPDALLAIAAQLLQTRKGDTAAGIGQALQAGQRAQVVGRGARSEEELRQMRLAQARMQMEEQKRLGEQQKREEGLFGQFQTPAVNPLTPMDDEGNRMPSSPASLDLAGYAKALPSLGGGSIQKGLALQQQLVKPPIPYQKLGKDEILVDPSNPMKPIARGPQDMNSMIVPDPASPGGWKLNSLYVEGKGKIAAMGASRTNVNLPPGEKAILKADADRLDELSSAASTSRKFAQTATVINDILKGKSGGQMVKLSADTARFLGIKSETATADDLAQALNTQMAVQVRAPGSGATSNIEFEAYKQAVPSLRNTEEGRRLMTQGAAAFAKRNAKLADHARTLIRKGEYTDAAMAEYDESLGSVLGDLKKYLPQQSQSGAVGRVVDFNALPNGR